MDVNNIIVAADLGFSDVKFLAGDKKSLEISQMDKFPSTVAKVTVNNDLVGIQDPKLIEYRGDTYYVGDDALAMDSASIIDMTTYEGLELLTPIFLHKVFTMLGFVPKHITLGLSIAHINKSKRYESLLKSFTVNGIDYELDVTLIPQGIVSKTTIDHYGMNLLKKDSNRYTKYTAVDIGMNTVDVFRVVDGETSLSLAEGLENFGITTILKCMRPKIKDAYGELFALEELSDILKKGYFSLRGEDVNVENIISHCMSEYIVTLTDILDKKYGNGARHKPIANWKRKSAASPAKPSAKRSKSAKNKHVPPSWMKLGAQ